MFSIRCRRQSCDCDCDGPETRGDRLRSRWERWRGRPTCLDLTWSAQFQLTSRHPRRSASGLDGLGFLFHAPLSDQPKSKVVCPSLTPRHLFSELVRTYGIAKPPAPRHTMASDVKAAPSSGLVVDSRPKEQWVTASCPYPKCRTTLEYPAPTPQQAAALSPTDNTFKVTCFKCKGRFEPPNAGRTIREAKGAANGANGGSGSGTKVQQTKRRIGTDERPLDMTYYDILGLPASATPDDIKRSYRKLAIKLHPDKNPSDPEGEEKFKQLATAYSVLSDPELRHKYNEFGASTPGLVPEDGFVDPEEVFGSLFGGARFTDIIGTISIGKDMKEALQQDEDELERQAENGGGSSSSSKGASESADGSKSSESAEVKAAKEEKERLKSEERARQREERVRGLAEKLIRKLSVYTESVRGIGEGEEQLKEEVKRSFREITRLEAEELKSESYGVELLHVVGGIYLAKSRHYLASSSGPLSFMGIGGIYHSLSSTAHVVSSTVSTVRAALELKSVFAELAKAEESGITEERKRELEEKAATKGMQALFKGASLEVESVIREVCERVLYGDAAATAQSGGDATALANGGTASAQGNGKLPPQPIETPSKETQRLRAIALGIVGSVFTEVKASPSEGSIGAGTDSEYVKVERQKREQQ
ncbi:unnamed protein product [Parajaminaea phylloscopi]